MEEFGFDKLPEVLRQLFEKVEHIEAMLEKIKPIQQEMDDLFQLTKPQYI